MAGKMVSFPSASGQVSGYFSSEGNGPGVIVIQEWWGLVPHVKNVADRFASAGFSAIAPDLYHGKSTRSPDEAGKLMMALDINRAEQELAAAVSYLRSHPSNLKQKVGCVGFCMGGALSLFEASRNPDIDACVVFYGGHPNVKPDLQNLKAPVLGLYAGKDGFVTPDSVHELDRMLTELGRAHQFHTYVEADHAFFNDERPEVYNRAAAEDAWRRTVRFLNEHLD